MPQPESFRARMERAAAANQCALRERLQRGAELPPPADFAASSLDLVHGVDVRELDDLPDDSIDLLQVVREAEGRVS
jgi:hypothetical protein